MLIPKSGVRIRACSRPHPASEHLFHYVVVRADLPRGIQAANIVHSAGESSPGNLSAGTHAVCLTAPNEDALKGIADRLEAAGVAFVRVFEPDAPYFGALMSIGLVPGPKEDLRRHLSSLPLLR